MPSFVYQVRDGGGAAISGTLEAASLDEAGRILRSDGKTIVELRPRAADRIAAGPRPRKIKTDDLVYFSNQLAVMVDTGVPLVEALDCIGDQTSHTGLQVLIARLADEVRAGGEFSTALSRFPKVFDDLFVSLVRASEVSGTMGPMLERLCSYLRTQREIRGQIRSAMMYPVGIMIFSVGILVAMMLFVLPRFEKIYASKQSALPAPTRMLLGISDVFVNYWMVLLAGAVAAAFGLWRFAKSRRGGYFFDKLFLRLPLLGPLFQKAAISRSFRTLATMITSGVELLDGIRIAAAVVGNRLHRDMWLHIEHRLREGYTLAEEMFSAPLIPRSMAQMIASGDKSGRVADVLNRIADFCDADIRVGVKAVTSMIEPAMIVIMGILVGGIAMALLLPIFSISKVVGQ